MLTLNQLSIVPAYSTFLRAVQPLNALALRVVVFFGIFTVTNELAPLNAFVGISVIFGCKNIDVILLLANALAVIFTSFPLYVLGNTTSPVTLVAVLARYALPLLVNVNLLGVAVLV